MNIFTMGRYLVFLIWFGLFPLEGPQRLYPISELEVGTWTGTEGLRHYQCIEECLEQHDGDDSYIQPTQPENLLKVGLNKAEPPMFGARHVIRVVTRTQTNMIGCDLFVKLRNGTQTVAQAMFRHDPPDSIDDPDPMQWNLQEYELSGPEIALISDYRDLELWLYCSIGHGVTDGLRVTAVDVFIE